MHQIVSSFHEMANSIKETDRDVVIFGAGVIGQVTTVEILKNFDAFKNVVCFIDNDENKWGLELDIQGRKVAIKPPAFLDECEEDTVILLSISRYAEAKEQLEAMKCTKNMDVYSIPVLCIYNLCSKPSVGTPLFRREKVIPPTIHYMWLGGKPLPENLKKCIESWRKFCPDYEIKEWNENNYDIEKHPYMKQAYEAGAYGFVPDYARLDILYSEGGIYLDTDVELCKSLDEMLYQEAFCGVEKWQVINFGGCSGAVKNHPMVKLFLDERKTVFYRNDDGSINRNTCGFYDTKTAIKAGYVLNGRTQNIEGMNIYAYDYFHPYDYLSGICNKTENTYSVHHFNGGWLDDAMKEQNKRATEEYLRFINNIKKGEKDGTL